MHDFIVTFTFQGSEEYTAFIVCKVIIGISRIYLNRSTFESSKILDIPVRQLKDPT